MLDKLVFGSPLCMLIYVLRELVFMKNMLVSLIQEQFWDKKINQVKKLFGFQYLNVNATAPMCYSKAYVGIIIVISDWLIFIIKFRRKNLNSGK